MVTTLWIMVTILMIGAVALFLRVRMRAPCAYRRGRKDWWGFANWARAVLVAATAIFLRST
jgi:hypothetical protein